MFFQNKPIIRYLYWQNRHDAIFLQILQFYQKYLGKTARFDFTLGNKQLIAFLKWEKNVYCFSQMENNILLLFSDGKRNFIDFLKKEKVAHIAFSGQEKPQNLRGRPEHNHITLYNYYTRPILVVLVVAQYGSKVSTYPWAPNWLLKSC